ncbi:MAG: DUF1064 domain-containing protein [Endomicrobium sp.]|jgi:hypothetical protein|nr:DUF1064 domain-containing protein [Endomicrobium sp.]
MRKNKYGAKKTGIDGLIFASKKEARRYEELKIMLKAKKIEDLQLQKSFELQESFEDKRSKKTIRPITYICDFFYYDKEKELYIVEDVKGMLTPSYKLKKKLFLKKYGDSFLFNEI